MSHHRIAIAHGTDAVVDSPTTHPALVGTGQLWETFSRGARSVVPDALGANPSSAPGQLP